MELVPFDPRAVCHHERAPADSSGKDNPLSNEKVRQAMNYAVNKDAIIQVVTHGVGTPMTSYMSSATPLHAGDKPLYPFDLEKAKA